VPGFPIIVSDVLIMTKTLSPSLSRMVCIERDVMIGAEFANGRFHDHFANNPVEGH
jgi:hypothetical protein